MKDILKKYNVFFVGIMLFLMSGCDKYLDVLPPSTSVNPTTIKDFEEMLNTDSLALPQFFLLDLISDDVQFRDYQLNNVSNYFSRSYLWERSIWNSADLDLMYSSAYSRILQMNIILSRVDEAPKDETNTDERKANVISKALIHRAWYYLQLVNAYGRVYDPVTASSDLGVPLILRPDANSLPSRATIQEVYDQILGDLKQAVANSYLPAKGKNILHPGKAAGYALLARASLLQSRYDQAEKYADTVLSLVNTIQDYNVSYTGLTQLEELALNPEILLGKITVEKDFYREMGGVFRSGKSLNDSLGSADLRNARRFTYRSYNVTGSGTATTIAFDNSVGTPEVYLIKAECLARAGKVTEAGTILDNLRKNRIPQASLRNRSYSAGNILAYVLGERRRELFYKGGLRLFDIKRLNKEGLVTINLKRQNENYTEDLATLEAGSPRFIMPFAPIIIANNPNIIQNDR